MGPLRTIDIGELASIARKRHVSTVITASRIPGYVENGLAVGVGLKGRKPEILINLEAARAEGANFNAQRLYASGRPSLSLVAVER